MKKLLVLLVLGLTACTSSQMAVQSLGEQYGRQHLDKFVVDHGAPYSAYETAKGGIIYEWSSGIDSVSMPQTINHTGTINQFGMYSGTSTVNGGGAMKLECAIKIITDKDKIIREIRIERDSMGHWEMSRCNEIFG
jgi:hypothetical protein